MKPKGTLVQKTFSARVLHLRNDLDYLLLHVSADGITDSIRGSKANWDMIHMKRSRLICTGSERLKTIVLWSVMLDTNFVVRENLYSSLLPILVVI